MARSIATIQATMDAEQALKNELTTLNSPSQTAIYTLWKFITSTVINYFEQLWDLYKVDVEIIIKNAAVGSEQWLQSKVLAFQYSITTPQSLVVDSNYAVNYPVIDSTLLLITRCSVITTDQRVVLVKVAKSNPPVALSAPELSSLSGYLNNLNFAGVNYIAQSLTSDKIYIKANIFYNGQYASTINKMVVVAINTYLANIPFNGYVKLTSLVDAIQTVLGVTDIVLEDIAVRADATLFANKTYMVQGNTTIINSYQLYAGYAVTETTLGSEIANTLTFTAQ